MNYECLLSEDTALIARGNLSIDREKLDSELRRFEAGERLDLDVSFFEKFRRKPDKRDLLFQAIKERNKKLSDKEIRKLLQERNYDDSLDSLVEAILCIIKAKDFSDYGIRLYRGCGILTHPEVGFENQSMSDAPYQFILTDNGIFIANSGFFPYPGRIEISQIQGFNGKAKELEPIKWSRCLIKATVDWAKAAGIPEVNVRPYHKNGWDKVFYNSNGHSHLVYDASAKREGFSYDKSRELFVYRTGGDL